MCDPEDGGPRRADLAGEIRRTTCASPLPPLAPPETAPRSIVRPPPSLRERDHSKSLGRIARRAAGVKRIHTHTQVKHTSHVATTLSCLRYKSNLNPSLGHAWNTRHSVLSSEPALVLLTFLCLVFFQEYKYLFKPLMVVLKQS